MRCIKTVLKHFINTRCQSLMTGEQFLSKTCQMSPALNGGDSFCNIFITRAVARPDK